jgi:F-type H+-transporting ATPase subunit delta
MAEPATLARPYARAAFDLAREEKRLAEWSALLTGLAAAVREPKVAMWIGHPAIGRGQLADVLIEAYGKGLSDTDKNLLRLLAEYNRLKLVPAIAEQFELLKAEAEQRADVEITSAAPVDPAQQKALADAIRKRLNREVDIEWKTDAELLGGARIRAGDLVIDHTIVGELEQLRTLLTA